MSTRKGGQENRRNARRLHSSTSGGSDAAHGADEDVAAAAVVAAAAKASKSKNGRPPVNVNVVIKTPDGSTVLNMNDAINEQDTRAIESDGTIMIDAHVQIAFGMLLRQGQVFVEHNGTYIKLSFRGVRVRRGLQLLNFKNENSRIRLGANEFQRKTPYFYLYFKDVNGERIITSAVWNQEHLSAESQEDFESQIRQVAPTSAAASGDERAGSENVGEPDEDANEWQYDSPVPSTDKTPPQQGKAMAATTMSPVAATATATTTKPLALKPPPPAASGKLTTTPQRARKGDSVPLVDKEPAKKPKLGRVKDVSEAAQVSQVGKMSATAQAFKKGDSAPSGVKNPNLKRIQDVSEAEQAPQVGKMSATAHAAKKGDSAPLGENPNLKRDKDVSAASQVEVHVPVEANGKMAATAQAARKGDSAPCGSKDPTKSPKRERVEEVWQAEMSPQDEGLAPGDELEEPHMASYKKPPKADTSDKKLPSKAHLPQRETGKPALVCETAIKVEAKDVSEFAKTDEDSSPGPPLNTIETIDLTNTDSESEMNEGVGRKLKLREWLEQKLAILQANADRKLPFSIQEIEMICTAGTKALKSDPLLLELDSPIAICGDIHGHFTNVRNATEIGKACAKVRQLQRFEQYSTEIVDSQLLSLRDSFYGQKCVFLGNVVDRGDRQLHAACYMLLLKALDPPFFHFVRGTHESPTQNQSGDCETNFVGACQAMYPDDWKRVWNCFNSVFARLPVAAVVDNEIFCAPGGLATGLETLDELKAICHAHDRVFDAKNPEVNPIFNELAGNHLDDASTSNVRSDPTIVFNARAFSHVACSCSSILQQARDGFTPSAIEAGIYSVSLGALNKFLRKSSLSKVVMRGEEALISRSVVTLATAAQDEAEILLISRLKVAERTEPFFRFECIGTESSVTDNGQIEN